METHLLPPTMEAHILRTEIATLGPALVQKLEHGIGGITHLSPEELSELKSRTVGSARSTVTKGEEAYSKVQAGEDVQTNMQRLVNVRDGLKVALTLINMSELKMEEPS